MTEQMEPRIYVASLSDYNAGQLHGTWIKANQDAAEVHRQVAAMLARSSESCAEEWAIHDYEGFGPLALGEWESLDAVAEIARGITDHGVAFAFWAEHLGRSDWNDLEHFEDCYHGHYEQLTDWASESLDAAGIDPDEHDDSGFSAYWRFDLKALARDLATDFAVYEDASGVYIFEP